MRLLLALIILATIFTAITLYRSINPPGNCNHGASSVSGHFETDKAGKTIFITDHPVNRTGC